MKRLLVVLFGIGCIAVFGAVNADTPAPALSAKDGRHFLHDVHKPYLAAIKIDVEAADQCKICHSIEPDGAVRAPAAEGHAPCLRSGCHASDFMEISKTEEKKRPQLFRKAATFCLGCHPTVPWPWKKQQTLVLQSWRNQREHHIEMAGTDGKGMDHYGHIKLAKKPDGSGVVCRDCHVVAADFKLEPHTPGHAQCMQCHAPKGTAFALSECGKCHKSGGRDEWLKGVLAAAKIRIDPDDIDGSRPKSSVRACDSQGNALADKKFKRKTPCFKHETAGHRMTNDNKDVQCGQCHHMISDERDWDGKKFRTIADLHVNKIIGTAGEEIATVSPCSGRRDKNDAQHAACSGARSCHEHEKQVDLTCTKQKKCTLCHAQRTNEEAF